MSAAKPIKHELTNVWQGAHAYSAESRLQPLAPFPSEIRTNDHAAAFNLKPWDFKKSPDPASEWDAEAATSVELAVYDDGKAECEVDARGCFRCKWIGKFKMTAVFRRNDSWNRNKTDRNLLEHEQGHFHLAIMVANDASKGGVYFGFGEDCDKEAAIRKAKTAAAWDQRVRIIQARKWLEYWDDRYDSEGQTNHNLNQANQKEWNELFRELSNLQ